MGRTDTFLLIRKLKDKGPLSVSELAVATDSEIEEVERKVEELLEEELIEICREEPQRYYRLSKKGKKHLSTLLSFEGR